jgi:hypothetical protein
MALGSQEDSEARRAGKILTDIELIEENKKPQSYMHLQQSSYFLPCHN